jgi:hypothetical protein
MDCVNRLSTIAIADNAKDILSPALNVVVVNQEEKENFYQKISPPAQPIHPERWEEKLQVEEKPYLVIPKPLPETNKTGLDVNERLAVPLAVKVDATAKWVNEVSLHHPFSTEDLEAVLSLMKLEINRLGPRPPTTAP